MYRKQALSRPDLACSIHLKLHTNLTTAQLVDVLYEEQLADLFMLCNEDYVMERLNAAAFTGAHPLL